MQKFVCAFAYAASNWRGAAKLAVAMIVLHFLCAAFGAPDARAKHLSQYQEPKPSNAKIARRIEPLAFGSTLAIKNPIGSIEMRGWDREHLYVQTIAIGESESAPILEINRTATGAEVIVKDVSKRRFLGMLPPKMARCDLIISLPRRVLADAKTINGAITASAFDGSFKCETINGRVQIERVLGRVEAKSVSGAIAMTKLAPSPWLSEMGSNRQASIRNPAFEGLVAKSVNGGVSLEDIIGDVEVSTIHGKIEARHIHVRGFDTCFETISGDIEIEFLMGASDIVAKSMAGRIDVQVPNAKMTEETNTQAVIQLPVRPIRPPKDLGRMQTITIKTVSGKITVR